MTQHAFTPLRLAACLMLLLLGSEPATAQQSPALDRLLQPILSQPSDTDLAAVKAAASAIAHGDIAAAEASAAGIAEPAARKLVRWMEMRSGKSEATPEQLEQFRRANPSWPGGRLRDLAEELLLENGEPDQILAFFSDSKPESGAGDAALAVAYLGKGDLKRATALASTAWRTAELSQAEESAVIDRLGKLLTPADHKWRADRILYADSQSSALRGVRLASVARLRKYMTAADQAKIDARVAVYRCRSGGGCLTAARRLFAKLPPEAQKDWGIFYHKAQMLRRSGAMQQAWRMMLGAPTDPEQAISPDDWWDERRVDLFAALYGGDKQAAYKLAAEHGELSVNPMKEAEFTAGWIALRFLNNPKLALQHFKAMAEAADGPVSRAQAAYWTGRAYDKLGDTKQAAAFYASAAQNPATYYGGIAALTLDKTATRLDIAQIPVPPGDVAKRFLGLDSVRAAVIADKAGLTDTMRLFLLSWKESLRTEPELVLAAHLALSLGDMQMAVKLGKAGMEKGFSGLTRYAFPVVALPAFQPLRSLPEQAIFYAIARQESEFNTLTQSGAGARGILQVMPGTAKGVCQQYKIKCDIPKLLSDPAYNTRLATAYIADRHDDFDGSYIMAFAGYNAGPGRVRDWVDKIGDPRDPSIDPIDWVELINLDETRDYVKKVMANVQVYRALLDEPAKALRTRSDLMRGRANASAN